MWVLQRKQWCFDSMVIYHGKNRTKKGKSDSSFPTCCTGNLILETSINFLAKLRLDPCHSVIRTKGCESSLWQGSFGKYHPPLAIPTLKKITSHNFVALRDMSVVIPQSLTWKTSKNHQFWGLLNSRGVIITEAFHPQHTVLNNFKLAKIYYE